MLANLTKQEWHRRSRIHIIYISAKNTVQIYGKIGSTWFNNAQKDLLGHITHPQKEQLPHITAFLTLLSQQEQSSCMENRFSTPPRAISTKPNTRLVPFPSPKKSISLQVATLAIGSQLYHEKLDFPGTRHQPDI